MDRNEPFAPILYIYQNYRFFLLIFRKAIMNNKVCTVRELKLGFQVFYSFPYFKTNISNTILPTTKLCVYSRILILLTLKDLASYSRLITTKTIIKDLAKEVWHFKSKTRMFSYRARNTTEIVISKQRSEKNRQQCNGGIIK